MNKEFQVKEGKQISFEYTNYKRTFKDEITEKIILNKGHKEQSFLITIKRYHENFYTIISDIEKENKFSLEIVFFIKDSSNDNKYIEINKKKIKPKENFPKTRRYNIININLKNSIELFKKYAEEKLDENNILFNENNLFYNFIYGNNKKIGKIFQI